MKKISAYLLVTMLLISPVFADTQTRRVDVTVSGKVYNDMLKMWSKYPVTVFVDSGGLTYVCCNGIFQTQGVLTEALRKKMIDLLNKNIEWCEKSVKGEIEITKKLGDLPYNSFSANSLIQLTFFSANKGKQTDVILSIPDFSNEFIKNDFYLNQEEVKQLIKALEQVPQTLVELKEQELKAKQLQ